MFIFLKRRYIANPLKSVYLYYFRVSGNNVYFPFDVALRRQCDIRKKREYCIGRNSICNLANVILKNLPYSIIPEDDNESDVEVK